MPKRDSLLGLCSLLSKIPDYSQRPSFECHFPLGDFSEISQVVATRKPKSQETVRQPPGEVKEDQGQDTLFSCPNVGCIKVYQHHCALELRNSERAVCSYRVIYACGRLLSMKEA